MVTACSDKQFLEVWNKYKSPQKVANVLGVALRNIYSRRRTLEAKTCLALVADDRGIVTVDHPARQQARLKDGVVLVGSDPHYWPGKATTAHRAFVRFCKDLKPAIVVMNGDVFDGSTISRWPRIGWDRRPKVKDELQCATDRLSEIEKAAKGAKFYWPMGNHDARFETFLAAHASEYEGVAGFNLKDRFPRWTPCWSLLVNNDLAVKHRFKAGIHAPHNNTMWAGRSMVTGHLHSLRVSPFTDLNGTRYGVDSGTLAEPSGDQFVNYTEDSPKNWRGGFVVLSVRNFHLMSPELAEVIGEGEIWFRGKAIKV